MSTNTTPTYYELYRGSSLGMALMEALDELIRSGHINPQLALKVLLQFDRAAYTTLSTGLKARCTIKGDLPRYNLVDEVWTFWLKDAVFRLEAGDTVGPIPKVKIVACKAPTAGDSK